MTLPSSIGPPPTSRGAALVIIGASTGGVRALCDLFGSMPALNAAFVVVQHMPVYIQASFLQTLQQQTEMQVALAKQGDQLRAGTVLLAPAGVHCLLQDNRRIQLYPGHRVNYVCPSVDVTMKSVIPRFGQGPLAGVLLTGMGRDGAEGMLHLKQFGAETFAQDEKSCAVFGMPKEAWALGAVGCMMPPAGIARKLTLLAGTLH